jgi:hypothetical protein
VHKELTLAAQSRSEGNNPCAPALVEPLSDAIVQRAVVGTLAAIIENDFDIIAFLRASLPARKRGQSVLFPLLCFFLEAETTAIIHKRFQPIEIDPNQ